MELIIAACIGVILGSYLNVAILRLHTGRSTSGRSGCLSCTKTLTWKDLVPIVSFVALRGRCRMCGSAISLQYVTVEILMTLATVVWWTHAATLYEFAVGTVLLFLLLGIAVYDIRHTIIPDMWVYMAIAVALLLAPHMFGDHVVGALITAVPLLALWALSRGRWMGFGDVKLALVFGAVLGWYGGIMSLFWGFVLGAVVGVFLLAVQSLPLGKYQSRLTMKSEIPFAPFLIIGFLLVWLCNITLVALLYNIL